MSETTVLCPFCNAVQPPGAGGRVVCARCGEAFAAPESRMNAEGAAPAAPAPAAPPRAKPHAANRTVGLAILGVMGAMAATGLAYALFTVDMRRAHDKALPPRRTRNTFPTPDNEPDGPEATAPARLAALGWMPPEANFFVGAHVAELRAKPASRDLLDKPVKLVGKEVSLGALKDSLGLDIDQIDHVVLGARLDTGKERDLTPAITVVVRTLAPYDAAAVRKAMKAKGGAEQKGADGTKRTVYAATAGGLGVSLWTADERTLVVGMFHDGLKYVPMKPHAGASQLRDEIREVLEKRLTAGVPFWAAGHSANWENTLLPTLAAGAKDTPGLNRLDKVTTVAAWLIYGEKTKLQAAFRCKDEAAAKVIENEDLKPLEKEGLKYQREGLWFDVQREIGK